MDRENIDIYDKDDDYKVNYDNDNKKFEITFNSNYYDEVTFELTGNSETKYYFTINRIVIGGFRENGNSGYVEIMYPEYKDLNAQNKVEYTENDFDVVATIEYMDGTTAIQIGTPTSSAIGISGDQINAKRYESGKNLMASTYKFNFTNKNNIRTVNFTVQYRGATDDIETYGGMFSGSGKGFTYELGGFA